MGPCDRHGEELMNSKQKNSVLVAGILAGVISLPLPWMSISNPVLQSPLGGSIPLPIFGQVQVTGFNGSVTFLVTSPIWLVIALAIGASVAQFMRQSKMFEIPTFVVWAIAILALTLTIVPLIGALTSGQASPGIGWLLGLFCAAAPVICLATRTSAENTVPPKPN